MTRFSPLLLSLFAPWWWLNTGCQSTVEFVSVPKGQVTLHTWDDINGAGDPLGETPLRLEESRVTGRIIKLAAPGHRPQFFAFPGQSQGELTLRVNLIASREFGEDIDPESLVSYREMNIYNRRLLAVVQALLDGDYQAAVTLAQEAGEEDSRLAVARVLAGLGKLYLGDQEGARVDFKAAQAIDPEDPALRQVIDVLQ